MVEIRLRKIAAIVLSLMAVPAFGQQSQFFTPGNLVVSVEGCGVYGGTCTSVPNGTGTNSGNSVAGGYGDNQGAPFTLLQFKPNGTTSATYVNSLVLPQLGSGANVAFSGEYGSSSEGTLQLSGMGQYLTLTGYGVNAATFDANPAMFGAAPSNALAQSESLTGQSTTAVPRVVALIDANGNVNTSTVIYNIFNLNNPRSAYTLDGKNVYVSGQGSGSDATGGVFLAPIGAVTNTPTAITGLDTTNNTIAQDTRDVQIYNNTLYVSVDSKEGSGSNRDYLGTLGAAGTPPTSLVGPPVMVNGIGNSGGTGKVSITSGANSNGNGANAGLQINISPESYFFANPSTVYVADSGSPKNNSATSLVGNGGLEKWVNSSADGSGTWTLAYTLYQGLNLVPNSSTSGASGLYGLTGKVTGGTVQLYATNYNITDLDPSYLYGVTDTLSYTTATQAGGEAFTRLASAPADSNFKGVSFAPSTPSGGVEIVSSPSGLAFTSAGSGCAAGTYTTPQTLIWTPGSSCTLSVASPQNGPGGAYTFARWEDGSTSTTHTVIAPSSAATYSATFSAATPMETVFVTDGGRVEEFNGSGSYLSQFAINGGGRFAGGAAGMAIDSNGDLFVSDIANKNVSEFSASGSYLRTFGGYGSGNGQFLNGIGGVAVDASGNVWVVDAGNDRVEQFSNTGVYLNQFGTPGKGNGQFQSPSAMAIDALGNIWVADGTRVEEFNSSGAYESQFSIVGGGRFANGVGGMAIDANGNFFLTDTGNKNVSVFNSGGTYLRSFGTYGTNNGQFQNGISGIATDAYGNAWVSDSGNERVQEFFNLGAFESAVGSGGHGNGQFQNPGAIAISIPVSQ